MGKITFTFSQSTMMRIVDEWRKKEIFPPDVISSILNDNGISLSVGYLEVTEKKIEDSNIPLKVKNHIIVICFCQVTYVFRPSLEKIFGNKESFETMPFQRELYIW
jgi:hypothetical protein